MALLPQTAASNVRSSNAEDNETAKTKTGRSIAGAISVKCAATDDDGWKYVEEQHEKREAENKRKAEYHEQQETKKKMKITEGKTIVGTVCTSPTWEASNSPKPLHS